MKSLIFIIFLLFFGPASCATGPLQPKGVALNYTVNEFKIFYSLEGDNALSEHNQQDSNLNHIPDYIESVALQLQAASIFYTQVLGLTTPLKTDRYQNRATFIAVKVKNIAQHGRAADEISKVKTPKGKLPALTISLSNDLTPDNLTPAHELFHLYQNGYSLFKNSWLTEGTARWAEMAFAEGVGQDAPLPSSQAQLNSILAESYEAKILWNRLARLCDENNGRFSLPAAIGQQESLIEPVFKDYTLHGLSFMRSVFEQLDTLSKTASVDRGVKLYQWSEQDQKHYRDNNDYILCAIKRSIAKTCSAEQVITQEMSAFLTLINSYPHCEG